MAENNLDLFSSLPDSLLFIIVSSLPFKEAAQTTLLSTRWRNTWLSTKNIQLIESFFVKKFSENNDINRDNFIHFAKNWIQKYQEPSANNFQFAFSTPNPNHLLDIHSFIHFADTQRVKVLDLDFSDPNWTDAGQNHQDSVIQLPTLEEEHKKVLEAIRLFSCTFSDKEFRSFKTLKSVSLGWISLTNGLIDALIRNCSQLKELSLKKCWGLTELSIQSPNLLQILIIDKCLGLQYVLIQAVNLRVFKYSGAVIPFDILDLDSLEEVDLDFGFQEQFEEGYGEALYQILGKFYGVRVLTLCSYMLQVIPTAEEPLSLNPKLRSLQQLTLKTSLNPEEYYGITYFINSFPKLQTLSLELHAPRNIFNDEQRDWLSEQDPHPFSANTSFVIRYSCLRKSLKLVKITGFKGRNNELEVLRYLVKYGQVLERLAITISDEKGPNGEDLSSVYQSKALELYTVKRASPNLNIVLV